MAISQDGGGKIVYTPAPNKLRNEQSGTVVDEEFAIVDQTNVLKQIQFRVDPLGTSAGTATVTIPIATNAAYEISFAGPRYMGNIDLASEGNVALSGYAGNVDGEALSDGMLVFLLNQTVPAENGLYIFSSAGSGSFSRYPNYEVGRELRYADMFFVYGGATFAQSMRILNHGFTVGSAVDQNYLDPIYSGASGTFTSADAKTVTVTNGLITAIV